MKKKILIADDDPMFVELVSARLRTEGFEVTAAFDSVHALMTAMRLRPDAILLDVKMPGGNGLDALQKLKRSSRTNCIPVVVASALDDPSLPHAVLGLGAAEFLRKPVTFDQVLASLRRHLGLAESAA